MFTSLSGNALSFGIAICFILFVSCCTPSGNGKGTEFDLFNDHEDNKELLEILRK